MIYRLERRTDCQFVLIISHLTIWRPIAGVSFSRSRATGCPGIYFFRLLFHSQVEPCFSAEEGKRWSLSSDLIIQSVDRCLCFSSGKAKHCDGIRRAGLPKSAISPHCCGATKCVYQMPISIWRDITHRVVNVWTERGGWKWSAVHIKVFSIKDLR